MSTASAEAAELQTLINDTFWTEKGHFVLAGWWRGAHLIVGLTATLAAGFAGATIIGRTNPILPGVAALIATLAGGVLTFLKPAEVANSHQQTGRQLGALRVEMRQVLNLDAPGSAGTPELRAKIADLATKKAEIDQAALHVADLAMWWVDRRMKAGAYTST